MDQRDSIKCHNSTDNYQGLTHYVKDKLFPLLFFLTLFLPLRTLIVNSKKLCGPVVIPQAVVMEYCHTICPSTGFPCTQLIIIIIVIIIIIIIVIIIIIIININIITYCS